jgi:spermidine synthase
MMARINQEKGAAARIGVVGLGTGTTACLAQRDQAVTFYEIDPLMVEIAKDDRLFTYLRDCTPNARIVLGDARLSLEAAGRNRYDLLAIDAFSSDAIPLHLITREALAVYARAVGSDGVILMHISNRYLDLEPVIDAGAQANGLTARLYVASASTAGIAPYATSSVWIALTSNPSRMQALLAQTGHATEWRALKTEPGFRLWTDNYSNFLSVLGKPAR